MNSIYVECPDGNYDEHNTEPELRFVLDVKKIGSPYPYLRPEIEPTGKIGPMAGGNVAGSCDSRFSRMVEAICGASVGVVPVHDRFETSEEYNTLSK